MAPIVVLFVIVVAAAASVAIASSGHRSHRTRALVVACAQKQSGLLRYVTSKAACISTRERAVEFAKDSPVYACIRPDAANGIAHTSVRDARGTVRRMRGPGRCGHDVQVVLPAFGPRSFCVDGSTHYLRNLRGGTPCHAKGEFKVVLAKRKPKPKPNPEPEPDPNPEPGKNQPPVAVADAASTDEDHGMSIAAVANDTDPNGDVVHVSSLQTAGIKGAAHIAADGTIAYDPNGAFESLKAGENGHDSFTYKLSDGTAESAVATVSVTVTGVNDVPVAHDDSATTTAATPAVVHILSNDTDAEGESLHVASVDTTATQGIVTTNPDGTVTYDPNGQFDSLAPGEEATDSFTYRAGDGHGNSAAATVLMTITGADDAPVLSGIESAALAYDTGTTPAAITGTLAVADVDDTTIESATVTLASGYVDGRDALGFTTQSGITGTWDHTTGVLSLTGSATKAQYESALRSVTFHATDPAPSGSRQVDFTVNDGDLDSNTVSRTITVTHVNHAPVAADDSAATDANATTTISVIGNDSDSDLDTLNVASVDTTGTAGVVTTNPDGTIGYDPNGQFDDLAAGDTATDTFSYKANDGTVDSAAATVTVTVTGVNDAPSVSGIESSELAYDTGSGPAAITSSLSVSDIDDANVASATVTITAGHVDGRDTLSFTPQSGITGTWDDATGVLSLTGSATKAQYESALHSVTFEATDPTPSGSRTIAFEVDDGHAAAHASNVASRTLTVTHLNHAPVAGDDTGSTGENGTTDVSVLANDSDSDLDTLNVASVDTTGTAGAVTANSDGTIGYDTNGQFDSLAAGATAHDTFTYRANDGSADSSPATVDITVTGTNDAPALDSTESSALSYDTGSGPAVLTSSLVASDVDSSNLEWAQVAITSGHSAGHDVLEFTSQDGISGSFDDAAGTMTLTGSSSVANYQAALRAVTFRTDATTDSGSRTISFQVDDAAALDHASGLATRDITVTHVNHPPAATDDSASTDEESAISDVSVLGNDSDADGDAPLHISSIDTTGTVGDVSLAGGAISYSPTGHFDSLAQDATTTDTFKYTAADPGDADSPPATVTVTITGVNDAPALGSLESPALGYDTGSGTTALTASLAVSDVDSSNLDWAQVAITSGHSAGHDTLSFADQNGISGTFDDSAGTLTLTGSSSVANYEAALRAVTFRADATTPSGSRTVSFQVDDGGSVNHASPVVSRDITVTHVNHAPTATDDSASTNEDSAISDVSVLGNDSDVDGDAPLHVSSIDTTGTAGDVSLAGGVISYTPAGHFDSLAQGATATDTFKYKAADPSDADSAFATATVTITGVDDAPVLANAGATALAYGSDQAATAISPAITATDVDSANLTGATIQIGSGYVNGKDVLSFADTSQITSSWNATTGTLSLTGTTTKANYESALRSVKFTGDNASGVLNASRSVSFQVTDGTLTSGQVFRTIDVTHVNQAPSAGADSFSGAVGNTKLAVSTSPSGPHTTITGNVLANDTDADGPHSSLSASAVSPTPSGATVSMNSDGTFSYVPPVGFTGSDSFQYTVSDNDTLGAKTASGTVGVSVAGPVNWYVNAAAAPGGDGRSDAPLQSLAPLSTGGAADAKDGAGDRIFVYGNASAYTAGIVLEASQQLVGEPDGLTAGTTTLVAAGGSNPVINATGSPAVTLASGVDVRRVDMRASGAVAVSGSTVSTATIGTQTAIGGSGGGVSLSGGSGAVTIGSDITTTGGHSVSVQNRTGGTVAFAGAVNDTGTGVQLSTNAGAAVAFAGKIVASTGTNAAFAATGGGTVTATQTASTLTSTTGRTLQVSGDTIGAAGLTFQSISANGAANGILLNATGSLGGLSVTGTGSSNSGGTIQSTTGHAVSLSDTKSVSLNDLNIQNPQHAGVKGANVHGFSLTNSTIDGAGAALSDPADASVAFNDTSGASDINVDGVLTVSNNDLSNAYGGGLDVQNYAGTISAATVTNNTISSSSSAAASKGSAIALNLFGSPTQVASLTHAAINSNQVTNFPSGSGIVVQGGNTSAGTALAGTYGVPNGSAPGTGSNIVEIASNSIAGDAVTKLNGTGISASVTGRGQGNFWIHNNGTVASPVRNTKAEGIATGAAGDVTVNFDVESNRVTANNVLGASGVSLGTDKNIQADSSTLATPVVNAQFLSNAVAGSSGAGIRVLTRDSNGTTRVQLANNSIGNPAQGATPGIRVDAGSSGSATYNPTVCASIANNTAGTGPADGFGNVAPGILLYKRSALSTTYAFGITGLTPSPAPPATVEAWVAGNNTSATGGGTWAGKQVAVATGDQFTNCTLPF